jgi:hypothetical protein
VEVIEMRIILSCRARAPKAAVPRVLDPVGGADRSRSPVTRRRIEARYYGWLTGVLTEERAMRGARLPSIA